MLDPGLLYVSGKLIKNEMKLDKWLLVRMDSYQNK